jgi:hypothetical protein
MTVVADDWDVGQNVVVMESVLFDCQLFDPGDSHRNAPVGDSRKRPKVAV